MDRYQERGFDSNEEMFFADWLTELGIKFTYKPEPFILSFPVRICYQKPRSITEAHLMHGHTYQPDFKIDNITRYLSVLESINLVLVDVCMPPIQNSLKDTLKTSSGVLWVDTKGSNLGKSRRSSDITFPINQKWLWKDHGVYVNSLIPDRLFERTFYPESALLTEGGKDKCKKTNGKLIPLREIVKTIKDVL